MKVILNTQNEDITHLRTHAQYKKILLSNAPFAFKTHKCGTINRQSKPIDSTGELDKAAGDSTYTIKWKKVLEEMIVP